MSKLQHARLEGIFRSGHGFARTKDITHNKIHPYHLFELEKKGSITRIKRGLYKWVGFDFHGMDEIAEVARAVPKGVLCLFSALSYYELTNFEPGQYYIAIPRADHVSLPQYPPIKLMYFSDDLYGEGIERIEREGQIIQVYNIEKTICDCAHRRKLIGQDIFIEALRAYMKRPDKNISRLTRYAKLFHVDSLLRPYLEMLL